MKQIILSVIVVLLVLGCGNPADNGSKGQEQIQKLPKTIDEHNLTLWYFEFTTDTFETRSPNGGVLPMGVYDAYTENDKAYDARTGKPLIWFEFYDPQRSWEYAEEQWAIVEPKAQSGDMIKWEYKGNTFRYPVS
jgi:hypothetical protein